jgi:hypothetical protein
MIEVRNGLQFGQQASRKDTNGERVGVDRRIIVKRMLKKKMQRRGSNWVTNLSSGGPL